MPELLPYAPGSPEWLAARRTGVTATDIVNILGIGSKSAYWVFWNKMGQVPDDPDNDRWRLGRFNEPYVIERWGEAHPGMPVMSGGLYRSSGRPWQMATLDAWADDGPLEVKTWADADKPAWQSGPPGAVRAQTLWQMDVRDAAMGHVGVVFMPSGEFRSYTIEHNGNCHDTDLLELTDSKPLCPVCDDIEIMRIEGDKFMRRLRLELPAPDPDASAATLAAVKARFAKAPDKQAEVDEVLWHTWLSRKEERDGLDEIIRRVESKLREQAGEASVYTVDGQPVARRLVVKQHVREHDRTQDYLKRINPETDAIQHALAQGKPMGLAKKEGKAASDE